MTDGVIKAVAKVTDEKPGLFQAIRNSIIDVTGWRFSLHERSIIEEDCAKGQLSLKLEISNLAPSENQAI